MKWLLGIIINAVLFMALAGFFKSSIYIEDIWAALGCKLCSIRFKCYCQTNLDHFNITCYGSFARIVFICD